MAQYSLYHRYWRTDTYFPSIAAYYFKAWKDYHMPPHVHDQAEIMYVLSGSCVVETMGCPKILDKGDFILLDAGVPHGLEVAQEMRCRMLNIEFTISKGRQSVPSLRQMAEETPLFEAFLEARCPYLLARDYYELYPALKNMILELDEKRQGHQILTPLYMSEILIKLARAYEDQRERMTSPGSLHVRKAITYLHQNYDQAFRMEALADRLEIHAGYLHRIFKEHTGCTPVSYLTRLRLNKAKMLLRRTEIPISQISDYVGINSRQYFTSLFKKHLGKSPSEYRSTVERWTDSELYELEADRSTEGI